MTSQQFGKRLTVSGALVAAALAVAACKSEDVGESEKGDTASPTVGGAAGIDTAGTRVNTERTGSVVAPGPGQIPGTPGAIAGDSAAAKTRATRP